MFLCISITACHYWCRAQELTATRLHLAGSPWNGASGAALYTDDVIPLVVANLSAPGQPIRFLGGPAGLVRAMEIGAAAETWIRGSLSVGVLTGAAAGEVARIGTIPATSGTGLTVDLTGTSTSSGIRIVNIGNTGTADAGILISSTANGTGTGIRIGSPSGGALATLDTAVDITGGTGLRYNALSAASGTAVEIGGTTAPQRGVDAIVAGLHSIGVVARASSVGSGVVGLSYSASYTGVPLIERTGVYGESASNSNVAADTLIGVRGVVRRGGPGGTSTFSVGVLGEAKNNAVVHSGYNVGVMGLAEFTPQGQGEVIAGLFVSETSGMSAVHLGGDVMLGSHENYRPNQVPATRFPQNSQTLTHMFSHKTSGSTTIVNEQTVNVPTGSMLSNMVLEETTIVRIITGVNGIDVTGFMGGTHGRMIILFNVGDRLSIHNNAIQSNPENRILTPEGRLLNLLHNEAVTLWYDSTVMRWRAFGIAR